MKADYESGSVTTTMNLDTQSPIVTDLSGYGTLLPYKRWILLQHRRYSTLNINEFKSSDEICGRTKTVLGIRIRSDPYNLTGSGTSIMDLDPTYYWRKFRFS